MRSYVDSGAARSVCPRDFAPQFGIAEIALSRKGEGFQTATGKTVTNMGERKVAGVTESGAAISMKYAVADVAVALDSVSQICDTGASVHFEKDGGWITDAGGEVTKFHRNGDTYIRTVFVDASPTPFVGQRAALA